MARRAVKAAGKRVPIPEFASREEEARFWDTHDLADYWDEFKPVEMRFANNVAKDPGPV
jgi:CopG antitoxin of type II toxin-antitoxin system